MAGYMATQQWMWLSRRCVAHYHWRPRFWFVSEGYMWRYMFFSYKQKTCNWALGNWIETFIIAAYVMLLCNREVCGVSTVLLHSSWISVVLLGWKTLEIVKLSVACSRRNHFFCDTVSVLAIISNCRLSDNVDGQIVATCMIHKQLLSKPLRFWMSPVSLLVTSTLLVMALAISRLSILTPLFDCGLWEGEAKGHDERCLALHDRLTMIFTTGLAFYAGEGRWTFPRFTLWLLCSTHRPTVSRSGCHALTGTDFSTLSETNAVIFHQMCWWWKRTCYIVIQKKKLNRTKIQWLSRSAGLCLWQTEHFDTFWYILFSKFEGFEFWTKCCDICSVWRFWMSFDSSRWGFGASLSAPHGPTEQEVISTAGETQVVFLGIFANKNKQKKR